MNNNNIKKFPKTKVPNIETFFNEYMSSLIEAKNFTDISSLEKIVKIINNVIRDNGIIYVAGNGGSHNIANHLYVDFFKGISNQTNLYPKVISLSSEGSLLTAVGNDIDFSEIFSFQLNHRITNKDVFIAISSSGKSPNIIKAIKMANDFKAETILFCGFEGGEAKLYAKHSLHFPFKNYGVVEDLSQIIMHVISQYIRMKNLRNISVEDAIF